MNTGREIVQSKCGLLTTVAFQMKDQPATYALEGSVAITGALVQWIRDNFGLIGSSPEIETLAARWRTMRHLLRAGVLGIVCALLEAQCARRHRRD